jgi:hypothetical protein
MNPRLSLHHDDDICMQLRDTFDDTRSSAKAAFLLQEEVSPKFTANLDSGIFYRFTQYLGKPVRNGAVFRKEMK